MLKALFECRRCVPLFLFQGREWLAAGRFHRRLGCCPPRASVRMHSSASLLFFCSSWVPLPLFVKVLRAWEYVAPPSLKHGFIFLVVLPDYGQEAPAVYVSQLDCLACCSDWPVRAQQQPWELCASHTLRVSFVTAEESL